MSGQPNWIEPADVVEERNLLRQIENALGIDTSDLDADDTVQLALLANTAHQGRLLQQLANAFSAGQITVDPPDVYPQVTIQNVSATLPPNATITGDFIAEPTTRIHLYDESVAGSNDNILSAPIQPQTDHSQFRVTVTLDTATSFSLRVEPESDQNFTTAFNGNGSLSAGSMYEFEFSANPMTEYNFRAGASCTVRSLRVEEIQAVS